MGDRCYLSLTLHGRIETVDALNDIAKALDAECLMPDDDSGDILGKIRSALDLAAPTHAPKKLAENPGFYDSECNYANIDSAEAVLRSHGVAYHVSHEEGGDYAAGCWSWTPEHGKVEAARAKGDGAVLSLDDVRKAMASVTTFAEINALIRRADLANGVGLPNFSASEAVLAHLGLSAGGAPLPVVQPPVIEPAKTREERAIELLWETLGKWEDEEDSVQEEKADHIAELKEFLEGAR